MDLTAAISLFSGLCWTVAYILIVRRGFLDRASGMPLVALCFNISWEFFFSFIEPFPALQQWISIGWFGLDVVILLQYLKFAPAYERRPEARRWFLPAFVATLVPCAAMIATAHYTFHDSGTYSSLATNVVMSMAFIGMAFDRNGVQGQSLWIGVLKMLGTLSAAANILRFMSTPLVWALSASVLFYDLLYIYLIYRLCRAAGINPWTRA